MELSIEPGLSIHNPRMGCTANVHNVRDGSVYYGLYRNRNDYFDGECINLFRTSIEHFDRMVDEALADGHVPFTLLG